MRVAVKIKWLAVIVFASSIFAGCTIHRQLAPVAIEDADEGMILIVNALEVVQVVENWGFQNGYRYVAFRRLQGGTESLTTWSARTDQDGTYRSSSRIVYTSQVLVIGTDNPNDAPERFNVVAVPSAPNRELTAEGRLLRGTGITLGATLLIILLLSAP